MEGIIFRVENEYGCRDYDTLRQAKACSHPDEFIKIVVNEWVDLSRVRRKYACPSWVKRVLTKHGILS